MESLASIALFPETQKAGYRQVFYVPASGRWDIEGSLPDAYYTATRTLIAGAARGPYWEGTEGVVGLFLFRHYLELRLKYALFHARWLKSDSENALKEDIEEIKKIHGLDELWNELKSSCLTRISTQQWSSWDIAFVDRCIAEFHSVDPKSFAFRYGARKLAVMENSEPHRDAIGIDFEALLENTNHAHDVLEAINVYLVESYHENEEWQSILNSL
jgi:hypothetical protein